MNAQAYSHSCCQLSHWHWWQPYLESASALLLGCGIVSQLPMQSMENCLFLLRLSMRPWVVYRLWIKKVCNIQKWWNDLNYIYVQLANLFCRRPGSVFSFYFKLSLLITGSILPARQTASLRLPTSWFWGCLCYGFVPYTQLSTHQHYAFLVPSYDTAARNHWQQCHSTCWIRQVNQKKIKIIKHKETLNNDTYSSIRQK